MLIKIPNLMRPEQIDGVRSVLQQCNFSDGKFSAGKHAALLKKNLEAQPSQDQFDALNSVVMTSLVRHPDYLAAAMPLRIAAPIYSRYRDGMYYGEHVDDPVMGEGQQRYRSDLSITLFLNEPTDYDGGELCITTEFGEKQIKLAAGSAIIYPSSSRHAVLPVTRGERQVAITWVQSMIRDNQQRQILYQLHKARDALAANEKKTAALLEESYNNLVRMWAEV